MDNKCVKERFVRLTVALGVVVFGFASLAFGAEYPLVAPINPEFTAWQSKTATFGLELRDAEGHTLGLIPSPIDRSHLLTQTRAPAALLEGAPEQLRPKEYWDMSLQSRTRVIVGPVGLLPRMGRLKVGS